MFFVLLLLWIILNGRVTTEVVVFGLCFAAVFEWFMRKYLGRTFADDRKALREAPRMAKYLAVLLFEIFKANFDVIRLILSPSLAVEPQLVEVRTKLKTDSKRALLANSITLTPGTITVRQRGGFLQVHCLDRSLAEGIEESSFVRMLTEMEAAE